MRKNTVLIDTFSLLQASTGVKTFVEELCAIDSSDLCHYTPFPRISTINKITVFKNGNRAVRLIYHCCFFLWKTVWLPWVIKWYKAYAVICPDFVGPMWKMDAIKIIIFHDATFWKFPNEFGNFWRKYIKSMIYLGCRGKSQIIATSEYTKRSLPNSYGRVPTEVIYQSSSRLMGYKIEELNGWMSQLGLEPGRYLLHVGFFGKRKNLRTLINAFDIFQKKNDDYKLVLAGGRAIDDHMDEHSKVLRLVSSLSLDEKVVFPGYIEDEILASLYQNAAMYVFPSYEEGFGIPIIEAMQFGLPIVVSNSGALPEIGGDAVLVHETFDPKDLAVKIDLVLNNSSVKEQLIEQGRKRWKKFSQGKFHERIKMLVESLP